MATEDRPSIESGSIFNVPHLAKVIGHLDPKYMGALEVQLLKQVGNTPKAEGEVYQVKYASPFWGQTSEEFNSTENTYEGTQKSYGMWMIPPDVGSIVIVVFAEGDSKQGYYIACVQDLDMNFMVPGYAATTFVVDGEEEREPTAEYNKKADQTILKDSTKMPKPRHTYQSQTLKDQGLIKDDTRGITTSSARREIPSMVFGISTPGPIDKEGPTGKVGKNRHEASGFAHSRLGGSSFVMDDGDDKYERKKTPSEGPPEYVNVEDSYEGGLKKIPHNELIRLRTRTGHQILLHNSEDLIYIVNSRGTAWIEISSDGKIDIFSEDNITARTKKDFNLFCDRDFNLEVGRNYNLKVHGEMHTNVGKDHVLIIDRDQKIHVKRRKDETIEEEYRQTVNDHVKKYYAKDYTHNFDSRVDLRIANAASIHIGNGPSEPGFAPMESTRQEPEDPMSSDEATSTPVEDVNGPTPDRVDIFLYKDLRIANVGTNVEQTVDGYMKTKVKGNLDVSIDSGWKQSAGGGVDLKAGGTTKISSGGATNIKSGGNNNFQSGGTANIKGSQVLLGGGRIHLNGPSPAGASDASNAAVAALPQEARKTAKATIPLYLKTHNLPDLAAQNQWESLGKLDTILRRVPTYEPYPHHEHLDPIKFKPTKEGDSPGLDRDSDDRYRPADDLTPTESLAEPPEYWRKYTTVTDTFAKITQGGDGDG